MVKQWRARFPDARAIAKSKQHPSSSLSFSLPCSKYITASAPDAPADGSRVQRPSRHETGTSSALLRCRLHSRIHGDPVFQLRRCSYNRAASVREGRIFISIFILLVRLLLPTHKRRSRGCQGLGQKKIAALFSYRYINKCISKILIRLFYGKAIFSYQEFFKAV